MGQGIYISILFVYIYNGFKVGDSADATYEAFKLEKRIMG
jgi:hypothetical protein